MKVFFIVAALIYSVAARRRDVSNLGYNYQGEGDIEEGTAPGQVFTDAEEEGDLGGNYGSSGNGFTSGSNGYYQEPAIIRKQYYLHTAPEDREAGHKHLRLGRPSKNYRVVFVKAPAPAPGRYSVEFAPQEEKTAIYVLAQKEHEINVGDIATPAPTQASKPDVFFVKYKTPQEAEHAQRQIQAQYDSLGGSSQFSDEGIAPLSSVIGSIGGGLGSGSSFRPSGSGSRNGYLPPIKRL